MVASKLSAKGLVLRMAPPKQGSKAIACPNSEHDVVLHVVPWPS